ncbi:MAG: hypothetical protein M1561_03880 [Gammaproteobacteria bacterium]|nr:hypothetical protein [Gammaproteobacteria bacterium]
MAIIKKIRTRIYLAVEGEGEQSFVRLLQHFADQNNLYVYLDCKVLGGGGYNAMLRNALKSRKCMSKKRTKEKSSVLLVDEDRGQRREDGWSLTKLRQEAGKTGFHVCVQYPNQEGLLWRMLPDNENRRPDIRNVHRDLVKQWPEYKKPVDFYVLSKKFKLDDLLRVAKFDSEINNLLSTIGFR